MDTVAIVGVGLIGGSFALALRAAGYRGRILGVSAPQTLEVALARGVIDEGLPLEEAVRCADWVYLAQPIERILETLERVGALAGPETLVTDAGSTKAKIVERGRQCVTRGQFLGGHPMAGKEARGVAHAEAGLFRGRLYLLTPSDPAELETERAREFVAWLERMGARPVVLSPEEHDRLVAFTSHLPQLASTALAAVLEEQLGDVALRAAGPGLADATRLALSPFEIWNGILQTNAPRIREALDLYVTMLEKLRDSLEDGAARSAFETGASFARKLRAP
ncbi:MAG: prephenate dehydrogenase [Bryobacterales bacterium]|nr:prephenate dehydrogenase [Bryobacteraceae bacterium]MDW8353495.1 prephenate dehydrogenase [Bryobacterales bacterium]